MSLTDALKQSIDELKNTISTMQLQLTELSVIVYENEKRLDELNLKKVEYSGGGY